MRSLYVRYRNKIVSKETIILDVNWLFDLLATISNSKLSEQSSFKVKLLSLPWASMVKEVSLETLASPFLLTLLCPCHQHRKWSEDGGGALCSRDGRNFPEINQLESSKKDCEKSGVQKRRKDFPEVLWIIAHSVVLTYLRMSLHKTPKALKVTEFGF